MAEIDADFDGLYDEDDEPEWIDDPDEGCIYDEQCNLVYSPWLEAQKVERVCYYCDAKFMGMPSHGVCDRCADILERGGDPC